MFSIKTKLMFLIRILRNLFPTSIKLILKTLSYLVSEVLLVEEDQEVSVIFTKIHNIFLSSSLITDLEDFKFFLRETHAEKLRNNLKRKLRKLEVERETKSLLKESMKLKLMSEELKNNTLRKSLLDFIIFNRPIHSLSVKQIVI
jgi:hypothetical protein